MKKEYLNESNYQDTKKKLTIVALIVIATGILIGGGLIGKGLLNNININSEYSDENKKSVVDMLEQEKKKLENTKHDLVNKGVKYSNFASYEDGEAYDLYVITKVLDPSFSYCSFDEYKNNSITAEYCSLTNRLKELNNNFNKDFDTHDNIPLFMFGGFIIIASFMIGGSVYMIAKKREVMAYGLQSVMPLAQEGLEKMGPTVAKVGKNIAQEMGPTVAKVGKNMAQEMAPAYGEIAKEISKGIKEGLKDEESNK